MRRSSFLLSAILVIVYPLLLQPAARFELFRPSGLTANGNPLYTITVEITAPIEALPPL
jgi:hypothetical protein